MRRVMALCVALAGCATPYQAGGFTGGYKDTSLGPGRWLVRVQVNGYTSRSTAMEYTYRRAAELCPGGFDVTDADRHTRSSLNTWDGGQTYEYTEKPEATLVFECRPVRRQYAAPGQVMRSDEL